MSKNFFYETRGTLTGVIDDENVEAAQAYLTDDDMTKYVRDGLEDVVTEVRWALHDDGHNYTVHVVSNRKLTKDERKSLGEQISGQNSDGLGEGFEQQDWAWAACEGCDDCEDNPFDECYSNGSMISFDWKTNPSKLVRVA